MGTRILKIDGEMPEIIDSKVGNPKDSVSRNWAILRHPRNLTFFGYEIFHAYMVQKYQNESAPIFYYGKSPKLTENT